ncbi:MAG TPA: hypothetical protein VFE33_10615 [Thermoanaerobaculia bacterium]|nr:hypothetical protein [Thermoanaerobaculia bacterium]
MELILVFAIVAGLGFLAVHELRREKVRLRDVAGPASPRSRDAVEDWASHLAYALQLISVLVLATAIADWFSGSAHQHTLVDVVFDWRLGCGVVSALLAMGLTLRSKRGSRAALISFLLNFLLSLFFVVVVLHIRRR